MDQLLNPIKQVQPLCIVLPAEGFRAKPHMIKCVPTFHGMESKSVYNFLGEYAIVCTVFAEPGQDLDLVCLGMIYIAMRDKASTWLNHLPPYSITSWGQMKQMVLDKFYPASRTIRVRESIS